MLTTVLFWLAVTGVFYAYFGYPIVLKLLSRGMSENEAPREFEPLPLSVIIPAHNEITVIEQKLKNTLTLDYPSDKLEIIVVSDGSTDGTDEIVQNYIQHGVQLIIVTERKGKANALNKGLEQARGEVVVYSDASIMLEHDALIMITQRFSESDIGCISGEDYIEGGESEGIYGRYELYLRNLESRRGSIVGASGSFYAQRRELCLPFVGGLAPDFLSVLNTVEKGYRAISESRAQGKMGAVKSSKDEFRRKVRTLLRGMATLSYKKRLLNPFRFGFFSFALFSHKLMRWFVPFFLIIILVANLLLADSAFYLIILVVQIVFYLMAFLASVGIANLNKRLFGKVPLFFVMTNLAILFAWMKFLLGTRQEIWDPSQRIGQVE